MSLFERQRRILTAVSTFARKAQATGVSLETLDQIRELLGGQLTQLPTTEFRWYLADLESAARLADGGDLSRAAQLWDAVQGDGVIKGVLAARCGGVVRLPRKFLGDETIKKDLEANTPGSARSLFDEVFPPTELALLASDGLGLGVGVGELLPVDGRDYPVFCRLDPQFLRYRWHENQWYYQTVAGPVAIVPGDGRWILHLPGGRVAPWKQGLWRSVGRPWIHKEHALLYSNNWESKLANPARVAYAPAGATEDQEQSWFQAVMAWGVNTVFGMRPGYEVKLLESNGRGYEAFDHTVKRSEREAIVAIAGQEVTVDGGAGFQNNDLFATIRVDFIADTAGPLEYTINTQGLPPVIARRYGVAKVGGQSCVVVIDVTPPADRKAKAQADEAAGKAIETLDQALERHGKQVDIQRTADAYGLMIADRPAEVRQTVKLDLAPTDIAKVVSVDEARGSQGLGPVGDERGELMISELEAVAKEVPAEPVTNDDGQAEGVPTEGPPSP